MKNYSRVIIFIFCTYLMGWSINTLVFSRRSEAFQQKILEKVTLAKKGGGNLDLRGFDSDSWDELAIWRPYANICKLKIKGSFFNPLFCLDLQDKGNCYLLFLKENKMVAKVEVKRRDLDFAGNRFPNRLRQSGANFEIVGSGDFPVAKIISK